MNRNKKEITEAIRNVYQQYPTLSERLNNIKLRSEWSLDLYLESMFGKGYFSHYRPESVTYDDADLCASIALGGSMRFGHIFCGIPGCGKTMTMLHIAKLIGNTIMLYEIKNRFEALQLQPITDSTFKKYLYLIYANQIGKETIDEFESLNPEFVFLDDLVFTELTDTQRRNLERVIEQCIKIDSVIFGTTNISQEDLSSIPEMGRVYSRLCMKCKFVNLKSVDYRKTFQDQFKGVGNEKQNI